MRRARRREEIARENSCEYIDNPAECSGPPHLLGPWGSAGTGRCEWPPHDTVPGRPPSHLRLITLESEPNGLREPGTATALAHGSSSSGARFWRAPQDERPDGPI